MDNENFDVVEQSLEFKLRGVEYVLYEPVEDANLKHRRAQFRNAKVRDDKVQYDLDESVEAPSVLLGECCFVKGADKPVGQKVVKGWPARLVKMLYEKAREMIGADDEATIDAQIAKLQELKGKMADPKQPPTSTPTD